MFGKNIVSNTGTGVASLNRSLGRLLGVIVDQIWSEDVGDVRQCLLTGSGLVAEDAILDPADKDVHFQ